MKRIRQLSRRKKAAFGLALFVLVAAFLEFTAWASLHFTVPDFTFEKLQDDQDAIARGGILDNDTSETIHPYSGWVFNPQVSPGLSVDGKMVPVNELGLVDNQSSIQQRGSNRLIIGVTGGSVSWQVGTKAKKEFAQIIQQDPRFKNHEIIVLRIGLPGWKQPQQLMNLNWLYSLGAEFDAVVNIDGFNEAVLSIYENYEGKAHTAYPRSWEVRSQDIVDPREYATTFELFQIRAERQAAAMSIRDSPFRWSAVRSLIWQIQEQALLARRLELGDHLLAAHRKSPAFVHAGPEQTFKNDEAVVAEVVRLWQETSRQCEYVCRGNGTVYLHALQPNQYLPGSKPMSDWEKQFSYFPGKTEAEIVTRTYPKMIAAGETLQAEGIHFLDLTMLFSDENKTIYIDPWCHYNDAGNSRVAQVIAKELLKILPDPTTTAKTNSP
jgi:hypothetical protein